MIIESGIIVAMGLVLWFSKMSWKGRMRILSSPLACDIGVFILLLAIHWGTYTGIMAATAGSVMVSLLISLGRRLWGYVKAGKYYRGFWDVSHHLMRV